MRARAYFYLLLGLGNGGGRETGDSPARPEKSVFKLDGPNPDNSGATHLPVFEDFRSRMTAGQVSEFAGSDSGEIAGGGETAPVTLDEDIQNDMLNAMSNRIRILKAITKGGIEVPQNRRQALKSALWSEFSKAYSGPRPSCYSVLRNTKS